jgi:D-alanyl-D-alanine dipeptidase
MDKVKSEDGKACSMRTSIEWRGISGKWLIVLSWCVALWTITACRALSQEIAAKPLDAPAKWKNLIGMYASPPDTIYIAEKDVHLFVITKKLQYVRLLESGHGVFSFGGQRIFGDTAVVIPSERHLPPSHLQIGSTSFQRLQLGSENEKSFRIKPLKPARELRTIALASSPPREKGNFLNPDLFELSRLDKTIKYDIRYATTNNFVGEKFYTEAKAFLQRPAAEALLQAHRWLKNYGYGLLIHDAYRPWYVTKMFWDATPEDKKIFVADPSKGSRHNRGCAVDLTLYDLKTGAPIEMTSGYDEMSERSYPSYPGGTSLERWHRDLLRKAMENQGFTVYDWEWWHFDYKDWQKYPIGTKRFEELDR